MRDIWGKITVAIARNAVLNGLADRSVAVFSVILCFALILCGCSIVSTPETSKEKAGDPETKELYVEKGVSPFPDHDIWLEESIRSICFAMGNDGKMSQFVLRQDENDGVKTVYGKLLLIDGEWIKEDISWQDAFDTMFAGKNVELQECYYSGDEFYCYTALNQTSGNIDVKVFDEENTLLNTIPTSVPFNPKGRTNIALGTKGNTIVMACEEGIFETEWDGEVFENKVGYETDNLYYLSPFSYQVLPGVYKGESGEYYTKMFEYDANAVYPEGISPEIIGYYSRETVEEAE